MFADATHSQKSQQNCTYSVGLMRLLNAERLKQRHGQIVVCVFLLINAMHTRT